MANTVASCASDYDLVVCRWISYTLVHRIYVFHHKLLQSYMVENLNLCNVCVCVCVGGGSICFFNGKA